MRRSHAKHKGDIFSKEFRKILMSKIGPTDTKPEIYVRSALHKEGFRFRLHVRSLPGRPDIVLPRYKTVIFVNGCFWHGHDCPKGSKMPKNRAEFWREKLTRNHERDKANYKKLRLLGWNIIVVWECELPDLSSLFRILKKMRDK